MSIAENLKQVLAELHAHGSPVSVACLNIYPTPLNEALEDAYSKQGTAYFFGEIRQKGHSFLPWK